MSAAAVTGLALAALAATAAPSHGARHVAVVAVAGAGGGAAAETVRGDLERAVDGDASGLYLREPRSVADDVVKKARAAGLSCKRADAACWKKVAAASGIDALIVAAVADGKLYALLVDVAAEPRVEAVALDKSAPSNAASLVDALFGPRTPPAAAAPHKGPVAAAPAPAPVVIPDVVDDSEPPAPPAAPQKARERPRVLVLELRNDGVGDNEARLLRDELTTALAGTAPAVEVMSMEDVRRQLALEGEKQAAGCSEDSCVGEIAQALGAEYVVYGDVGKLGSLIVAHLTLQDAKKNAAVVRHNIEVDRVERLAQAGRDAAPVLAAQLPGGASVANANGTRGGGGLSWGFVTGVAVTTIGAVALVAGAGVALFENGVVSDVSAAGPNGADRLSAQQSGQAGVVVAAMGGVVAAGGGALLALGVLE